MWMALVEMNVWMRGLLGALDGVPGDADVLLDGPRQAGDARPLHLAGDRLDRLEIVRRGDRKAGLDDVDAQRASWRAISSFSALFMLAPGACSPSRSVVSKMLM